jgi:hypothetical protein
MLQINRVHVYVQLMQKPQPLGTRPPPSPGAPQTHIADDSKPSAGFIKSFDQLIELFQAMALGLAVEAHGSHLMLLAACVCYHC